MNGNDTPVAAIARSRLLSRMTTPTLAGFQTLSPHLSLSLIHGMPFPRVYVIIIIIIIPQAASATAAAAEPSRLWLSTRHIHPAVAISMMPCLKPNVPDPTTNPTTTTITITITVIHSPPSSYPIHPSTDTRHHHHHSPPPPHTFCMPPCGRVSVRA